MLTSLFVWDRMNRTNRMKTNYEVVVILFVLLILSKTNRQAERAPLRLAWRPGNRVGLRLAAVRLRLRLLRRVTRRRHRRAETHRVERHGPLPRRVGRAARARRRIGARGVLARRVATRRVATRRV